MADRQGPGAEDRPPNPRAARDRYLDRSGPPAGLQLLRTMSAEETRWLRSMVLGVARDHGVEPDDLLSNVMENLSRDRSVEAGREGLRSWLRQRAVWRARDLRRAHRDRDVELVDPVEQNRMLDAHPSAPARRLEELPWLRNDDVGLTVLETQVIGLGCWGFDLTSKELAQLADASESAVRKAKQRGVGKFRALFTEAELAVFVPYWETGSLTVAAQAAGCSSAEARRLVDEVMKKIVRVLDPEGMAGYDLD